MTGKPKPPGTTLAHNERAPVGGDKWGGEAMQAWLNEHPAVTVGWKPTCGCNREDTEPAVVLDPFAGSGTTGIVALALNRRFVGVELNAEYAAMARKRLAKEAEQLKLHLP